MLYTRRKIITIFALLAIFLGGIFYFRHQVYYSRGSLKSNKIFEIKKGEGNTQIASRLKDEKIISGGTYFYYYLRSRGLLNKIYPGQYLLSGDMSIPEIVSIITNPEKTYERVLLKEGWTAKQMAEELSAYGFDGGAFLTLSNDLPPEIASQFPVLATRPDGVTLEGYLFPDTYYFSQEATPEGIIKKILNNAETKLSGIEREASGQNKSLFDILTMASIIEREVATEDDRAIVSGIFWNRLQVGQALQSDATLTYIFNDKTKAHTLEQTKVDSPYNTYQNPGLPPGPISNPGLAAINAALNPKDTDYNYFLSDPATDQTIFSVSFEEHNANKVKYGL